MATTAKKNTVSKSTTNAAKKKITKADIRKKAQKIYESRVASGIPGDEISDWVQAKQELGAK